MENISQIPNLQPIQPVKPVKNQNIFKYLFIASLIIILGMVSSFYFYFDKKISKISEEKNVETTTTQDTIKPTSEPTIKTSIDDAKKVLTDLQKYLNIDVPITKSNENFFGRWLVKNDQKILLNGFGFRLDNSSDKNTSKYDSFFESNQFIKDSTNNYFWNSYQTIGYFKNDLKCLTNFDDISVEFFCGIPDQQQLLWRKELFSLIGTNETNTKGSIIVSYTSKVINLSGNYALVHNEADMGGTGGHWIAAKISGVWKIIWTGQDTIKCDVVDQYQIPKEIYGSCQ